MKSFVCESNANSLENMENTYNFSVKYNISSHVKDSQVNAPLFI